MAYFVQHVSNGRGPQETEKRRHGFFLFPADVQKEGAIHEKHEKNGWGVDTEKCVIRYKVLYLTRIGKWTTFFRPSTRQARLGKALSEHGIPFVAHQALRLFCKGEALRQTYMADLVRYESIIVEQQGAGTELPVERDCAIKLFRAFRGKRPQASKKSFLKS